MSSQIVARRLEGNNGISSPCHHTDSALYTVSGGGIDVTITFRARGDGTAHVFAVWHGGGGNQNNQLGLGALLLDSGYPGRADP